MISLEARYTRNAAKEAAFRAMFEKISDSDGFETRTTKKYKLELTVLRIFADQLEELKALSEESGISTSELVRRAIENLSPPYPTRSKKIPVGESIPLRVRLSTRVIKRLKNHKTKTGTSVSASARAAIKRYLKAVREDKSILDTQDTSL